MKLLSINADTKTSKSIKYGYLTAILYLSPNRTSGYNLCPKSTPGCEASCLYWAGRGMFNEVLEARMARSEFYNTERQRFIKQLEEEIGQFERKAERAGLIPCLRLNGTSDQPYLAFDMAKKFPLLRFYDYTKIPDPWKRELTNYHLTFSRSENNGWECADALINGINVSVVGDWDAVQRLYPYERLIDGDEHDLRFLDPRPSIVVLKPKGRARKDTTGFVVR